MIWRARTREIALGERTLVMGIVNVTPDSFSDGGQFADADAAVARGRALLADGADLLDVGGESSRPGSLPVPVDEELRRVIPVVDRLAGEFACQPGGMAHLKGKSQEIEVFHVTGPAAVAGFVSRRLKAFSAVNPRCINGKHNAIAARPPRYPSPHPIPEIFPRSRSEASSGR